MIFPTIPKRDPTARAPTPAIAQALETEDSAAFPMTIRSMLRIVPRSRGQGKCVRN